MQGCRCGPPSWLLLGGMHIIHLGSGCSESLLWHADAWHPDAGLPLWTTADLGLRATRRLKSGGHKSGGGPNGPSGETGVAKDVEVGVLFIYLTLLLFGMLVLCYALRRWREYLNGELSPKTVMQDLCMMLRFLTCGLFSRHYCWFSRWFCRRCCGIQRYRTMPEMSSAVEAEPLPRFGRARSERMRASAERVEIWQREIGNSRSEQENATSGEFPQMQVSGREYLKAQARTAVSAYEPPREGTESDNVMTECIICLEAFVEGAQVRTLPCLHRYHKTCIDQWFSVHLSCPLCNHRLSKPRISRSSVPGSA